MRRIKLFIVSFALLIIFNNNLFSQNITFDFKARKFIEPDTASCRNYNDGYMHINIININLLKYAVTPIIKKKNYQATNPFDITIFKKVWEGIKTPLISHENISEKSCDSCSVFLEKSKFYINNIKSYANKVYDVVTKVDTQRIQYTIDSLVNIQQSFYNCPSNQINVLETCTAADELINDLILSYRTIKHLYYYNLSLLIENADQLDLTLKFVPRNRESTKIGILEIGLDTFLIRRIIYPTNKWSWRLSAGYSFDKLTRMNYSWKDETPDNTFINNIDSFGVYSVFEVENNSRIPALVSYGHLLFTASPDIAIGAYIGIVSHLDEFSPDFHYGVSIGLLKKKKKN